MKKYLIPILLALITSVSFGQSTYQDVVHLKNGSIIRGIIIEQVPDKSIKIETVGRNVFVYQMDEIERLTKEPSQRSGFRAFRSSGNGLQDREPLGLGSPYYGLKEGYKGIVEFGYEIGSGTFGMDRLKLNIINGYQLNSQLSLSLGTGLRQYFDAKASLIPVFADFRAHLTESNFTPYTSLGVGYSFDATNSFRGVGFLLNPTVGVSIMVSNESAVNVGIGYEMQRMDFLFFGYSSTYWSKENSSAFSINIGTTF